MSDESKIRNERGGAAAPSPGLQSRAPNNGNDYYNEESEVERAMRESKKTAQMEESRRLAALKAESDFQKAIDLSNEEAKEAARKEAYLLSF